MFMSLSSENEANPDAVRGMVSETLTRIHM